MSNITIHFGPIYGRPTGSSMALCSPAEPSLMSASHAAVTCSACLALWDQLEECACGRTYEPVDENGEDAGMCPRCAENAAEAAYERSQEEPCYRGGEWAAAQREEADWIRRNLK